MPGVLRISFGLFVTIERFNYCSYGLGALADVMAFSKYDTAWCHKFVVVEKVVTPEVSALSSSSDVWSVQICLGCTFHTLL